MNIKNRIYVIIMLVCNTISIKANDEKCEIFFNNIITPIDECFKISDNTQIIPESVVVDANMLSNLLVCCELICDFEIVNIHTQTITYRKFNLLKDWYYINKDKLHWDIIEEAMELRNIFDNILLGCDYELYLKRQQLLHKRLYRNNIITSSDFKYKSSDI